MAMHIEIYQNYFQDQGLDMFKDFNLMQFIGGIRSYPIESFSNNTCLLHLPLFILSILYLRNPINVSAIIPIITKTNIILKLINIQHMNIL